MSKEIDWSKAPEGATHAAAGGYMGWADCWYKKDGEQWFAFLMDRDDAWEPDGGTCGRFDLVERIEQWTGTGLPPVGTVCEAQNKDGNAWEECEVIAHSKISFGDVVVFKVGDKITYSSPGYFRPISPISPIRTQAQIEAEERADAVKEMIKIAFEKKH